jgi:DNA (cytosine-5)-methyltransferase 1
MQAQATGKKPRLCYHCRAWGHRARDCPQCICSTCGTQGHEPPACPLAAAAAARPLRDLGSFGPADTQPSSTFTYTELFAGIGGFRVALDAMGGRCVFASEIDRFARASYADNHGGELPAGDITTIDTHDVPEHDLLTAGFPCQPFSFSGARKGFGDTRGTLFREIVRLASARRPKALLLENVRGLELHDEGRTLATIVHELQSCGYGVMWKVIDAAALLPQQRLRLFIVALRNDISARFEFPRLPSLGRVVSDVLQPSASTDAQAALSADENERLTLTQHQLGKVLAQSYTRRHLQAKFLHNPAVAAARTVQSSYGHYMVGSQFVPADSRTVALDTEAVAAQPWRRFSARECARLQGFPESWRLHPQRSYNLLGNAVPPPLVAMLAGPLLVCCGIRPFNLSGISCESDRIPCIVDGAVPFGWQWGWRVASKLLLEAAPVDGQRRDALSRRLSSVSYEACQPEHNRKPVDAELEFGTDS